jgi:hypothetical protein
LAYGLVYFLNSKKIVQKLNTIFMITFLLSMVAFSFI